MHTDTDDGAPNPGDDDEGDDTSALPSANVSDDDEAIACGFGDGDDASDLSGDDVIDLPGGAAAAVICPYVDDLADEAAAAVGAASAAMSAPVGASQEDVDDIAMFSDNGGETEEELRRVALAVERSLLDTNTDSESATSAHTPVVYCDVIETGGDSQSAENTPSAGPEVGAVAGSAAAGGAAEAVSQSDVDVIEHGISDVIIDGNVAQPGRQRSLGDSDDDISGGGGGDVGPHDVTVRYPQTDESEAGPLTPTTMTGWLNFTFK